MISGKLYGGYEMSEVKNQVFNLNDLADDVVNRSAPEGCEEIAPYIEQSAPSTSRDPDSDEWKK